MAIRTKILPSLAKSPKSKHLTSSFGCAVKSLSIYYNVFISKCTIIYDSIFSILLSLRMITNVRCLSSMDSHPQIRQRGSVNMGCLMRKRSFCICENKDAADQRLWFRFIYSNIPLLPKFEISSFWQSL